MTIEQPEAQATPCLRTTPNPYAARTFPDHRALVDAVRPLQAAGLIEGFAPLPCREGLIAGVLCGDAWFLLAGPKD